jgi:hypothetical protein
MPSLSEAYSDRRNRRTGRDPRRVFLGAAVSVAGVLALVCAMLLPTTPLAGLLGVEGELAIERLAGVLAGVGAPTVLLGVVAVLPSRRRQQVGVVLGALVAYAGVGLFAYAYPGHWVQSAEPLVFETALVYFLGSCIALWHVFVAVANFKRRNDPRGTLTLEIKQEGETRRVEVTPDQLREYKAAVGDGGTEEEIVTEIDDRRR